MSMSQTVRFAILIFLFVMCETEALAMYQCRRGTVITPSGSSTEVACWDDSYPDPFTHPGSIGGGQVAETGDGASSVIVVTLPALKVAANQIKCKILSKDYNNREYIGFVYGTPGGPTASNVIEGTPLSANVGSAVQQLGLNPNQILAMIHNHDINTYGAGNPGIAIQNQVPSSTDWTAYNSLSSLGENNFFGQFIVGPDGVMRYFDGSNRNTPPSRNLPSGSVSGGSCS